VIVQTVVRLKIRFHAPFSTHSRVATLWAAMRGAIGLRCVFRNRCLPKGTTLPFLVLQVGMHRLSGNVLATANSGQVEVVPQTGW